MKTIITIASLACASVLFYFFCLNHVSINEIGVAYDSTTGHVGKQEAGWHVTHPLVQTTTISTLPFKVEMFPNQSNLRVLNVKLIRFVPEHLDEFIRVNGFQYIHSNGQAYIFAPYAFDGKKYSFIEIIQ